MQDILKKIEDYALEEIMGERFASYAKEIIQDVVGLAAKEKHQFIAPEHLLSVLLNNKDNATIIELLEKSGADIEKLKDTVEGAIKRLPQVSGEGVQSSMSQEFTRVMMEAEKLADKSGDSYVTVERILQALAQTAGTKAYDALKSSGLDPIALNQAINDMRKGRVADSESAEDNFNALKKYAIDITARAKEGKLDPVIGREHEIRRTIQVLSGSFFSPPNFFTTLSSPSRSP